jgi:hypothetical protein
MDTPLLLRQHMYPVCPSSLPPSLLSVHVACPGRGLLITVTTGGLLKNKRSLHQTFQNVGLAALFKLALEIASQTGAPIAVLMRPFALKSRRTTMASSKTFASVLSLAWRFTDANRDRISATVRNVLPLLSLAMLRLIYLRQKLRGVGEYILQPASITSP